MGTSGDKPTPHWRDKMITQKVNFPRMEVKARISKDLHARMMAECGHCGCHINGFIAIAIAHEVAKRRAARKTDSDAYIETTAEQLELRTNA